MLTLRTVTLTNWCQFNKPRTFNFVPGTNGLVGPNGRGKSNVLAAIEFLVTGKVHDSTLEENIFYGADDAEVEGTFDINGISGHVCRTLKAPKREDGSRNTLKSNASMKFGNDKVRGTQKVSDELVKLTGFTSQILSDHVFIAQRKIIDLLYQQNADRMKSFIELIPCVSQAEPLRAVLQQELLRYPEVELGISLDSVKQTIAAVQAEMDALKIKDKELGISLTAIDYQGILQLFERKRIAEAAVREKRELEQQAETIDAEHQDLLVQQAVIDTDLTNAEADQAAAAPVYEQRKAQLQNLEQAKRMYAAKLAAEQKIIGLQAMFEKLVEPVDPGITDDYLDRMSVAVAKGRAEMLATEKVVTLLKSGNTTCPTCGNKFSDPATTLAELEPRLAKLNASVSTVNQELQGYRQSKAEYARVKVQYDREYTTMVAAMESAQKLLQDLGEVAKPEGNYDELKLRIAEVEAVRVHVSQLAQKSQSLGAAVSRLQARHEVVVAELDKLGLVAASLPDTVEIQAAQATKDKFERLQGEQATVRGTLRAKEDELARHVKQAEEIERLAARAGSIRQYRELLTQARDVLHRDNLPAEALSVYMTRFERELNRFLALFGDPFAIKVEKDMSIECIMPSGIPQAAHRLSGGQGVVLSVAARFAIHELFAADLGFLVLDEPSESLDVDNVQYLASLMKQVATVSRATSAQLLCVTHHVDEMRGCFDNLIEL